MSEQLRAVSLDESLACEHNAAVAARSSYPPRPDEPVNWGARLWDSDGYEHVLIDVGARQVVTKLTFAYAVWDRRTGRCLSYQDGGDDLVLRNRPLTDEEFRARREQALMALRQMHSRPEHSGERCAA